jgi:hypothetical protein
MKFVSRGHYSTHNQIYCNLFFFGTGNRSRVHLSAMIDCEPTVPLVPNLPLRTMPDLTRIVYVLPPNHPVPSHSNELNAVVRRR